MKKEGLLAVAVTAREKEDFVAQSLSALEKSDLVELRIDYLKGVSAKIINEILAQLRGSLNRVCLTCRRKNEYWPFFRGTEEDRINLLRLGLGKVGYLDIEDFLPSELIDVFNQEKGQTKIIISHHNFLKTPSFIQLQEIWQKQVQAGADICKVVTMAKNDNDLINIFRLLIYAKNKKKPTIGLAMGEKGILSRILFDYFGGYLTFLSLKKGSESAPGQLTLRQYKEIKKELKDYL